MAAGFSVILAINAFGFSAQDNDLACFWED